MPLQSAFSTICDCYELRIILTHILHISLLFGRIELIGSRLLLRSFTFYWVVCFVVFYSRLNGQTGKAYYRRGLARLLMNDSKGILDVNKALALDPTMWQAYVTRASFHAASAAYPRAILNCNAVCILACMRKH